MFFLLLLFALLGLSLLFFIILILISTPKKYTDEEHAVELVKVVEEHRKILPLSPAQGWSLFSSNYGLRCWVKELSSIIRSYPVTVFGCSKQINCSAVIVLNVIADISTWPEWDTWAEGQSVHLEVAEDPSLHGDRYMQCDQLVVTNAAMQAKPEIVMYRFGNLESNGVGWILLWNAKCLDWTFYVAQPVDSCSFIESDPAVEKCMLTAISGSDHQPLAGKGISDKLSAKIQNLSNAIMNSHFKIRPLQPLIKSQMSLNNPHFPTIHSALDDLPEKPCVLLKYDRTRQLNLLKNSALAVVPCIRSGKIADFRLVSRVLKEMLNGDLHSDCVLEEKRRSRKRNKVRSDSVSHASLLKHLQNEGRRSSSLTAPVVRKKLPELTITQADEEPQMPPRAASHSFLNLIFHRRHSSDGSIKKAESRSSTPVPEKKLQVRMRSSSASSQEDIANHTFTDRSYDGSVSDNVDSPLSLFHKTGGGIDYKNLGDSCINSVLRENLKISLVDMTNSEDEQRIISGGWSFKELNKDVSIFKKLSMIGTSNVISYLCKGLIPSSYKNVWKTICNPLTRFMYDDTAKKISILSEYSSGQKLIHMYNESVTLLRKEVQDFCLLQTQKEDKKKLILAFHSVDDQLCPPMKDVIRGTVIASGWIIERAPEVPHATMISYLMQMVIGSPDNQMMEEISNTQCQCINNLSTYLATQPTN